MLGLAVCEGQFDIIKYLVTECSVSVNGEQSMYMLVLLSAVSMSTFTVHFMYSTSTQVFTLTHSPTAHRPHLVKANTGALNSQRRSQLYQVPCQQTKCGC